MRHLSACWGPSYCVRWLSDVWCWLLVANLSCAEDCEGRCHLHGLMRPLRCRDNLMRKMIVLCVVLIAYCSPEGQCTAWGGLPHPAQLHAFAEVPGTNLMRTALVVSYVTLVQPGGRTAAEWRLMTGIGTVLQSCGCTGHHKGALPPAQCFISLKKLPLNLLGGGCPWPAVLLALQYRYTLHLLCLMA